MLTISAAAHSLMQARTVCGTLAAEIVRRDDDTLVIVRVMMMSRLMTLCTML